MVDSVVFVEFYKQEDMKYNKWTEENIEKLRNDYLTIKDLNVIAKKWNFKVNSLKSTLQRMGIHRGKKFLNIWTEEQEEYLRKNYKKVKRAKEIADYLGKSVDQIYDRAIILGVNRYNVKR